MCTYYLFNHLHIILYFLYILLRSNLIPIFDFTACESAVTLLFDTVMHLGCKPYLDSQRSSCICHYEEKADLWTVNLFMLRFDCLLLSQGTARCNTICFFTLYAFIAMSWLTVYFVITEKVKLFNMIINIHTDVPCIYTTFNIHTHTHLICIIYTFIYINLKRLIKKSLHGIKWLVKPWWANNLNQ